MFRTVNEFLHGKKILFKYANTQKITKFRKKLTKIIINHEMNLTKKGKSPYS